VVFGENHVGEHVILGLVHQLGQLTEAVAQAVGNGAPFLVGGFGGLLREGGADGGRHHRPLRGPTWASAFLMKWTRQRCQVEESTLAAAAFKPSCASEMTSLTPRRPRRVSERRNLLQNGSASEGPTAMPSTSRRPSLLTPTAIITATDTILPPSRTFT
jgi:hypothetical protein